MKSRNSGDDGAAGTSSVWLSAKKKKKNVRRLGGGGLSLESFANMKPGRSQYNPAIAKKQREFYKNAKYVSKYKRTLKHHNQQNDLSMPSSSKGETEGDSSGKGSGKKKKKSWNNLNHLYEAKREADEKARMEREAAMRAKKEEMDKAATRRKAERGKMLKRTRSGQPRMKYRIEHLLQTIQGSS
ncbi:hypothetical protein MLD38_028100 [Melastoma candidum]|uniref:Uncharacterized protein n=1 Tax=Melastoma candidum TaxID=119954 RepID=A0ACB9N037_9MYRT|nr:hypothetical protein MLD38_028100 [Melastoma candidum]